MLDSKLRFSTRVDNYVKYRPHYPDELIDILREECGLQPDWQVADVGCGTGISSELFVKNGNIVYGIEPNKEMRSSAESYYKDSPGFISINGSAEDTTLDDSSVDMVIAGQAFHWFDRKLAKEEFLRILKPQGWIVLFWNRRRTNTSPFMTAYEEMIRSYSMNDGSAKHRNIDDKQLADFFAPSEMIFRSCANYQILDVDGLIGRTLSHSSMPEAGDEGYAQMIADHHRLFDQYQQNGTVTLEYDTHIYIGNV
ncbi:MAG: class I SAM-dependent methyltransferase [Armatimonadota bacterium]